MRSLERNKRDVAPRTRRAMFARIGTVTDFTACNCNHGFSRTSTVPARWGTLHSTLPPILAEGRHRRRATISRRSPPAPCRASPAHRITSTDDDNSDSITTTAGSRQRHRARGPGRRAIAATWRLRTTVWRVITMSDARCLMANMVGDRDCPPNIEIDAMRRPHGIADWSRDLRAQSERSDDRLPHENFRLPVQEARP